MKTIFAKKNGCLLMTALLLVLFGSLFVTSCSNHIDDLIVADIDVSIDVDFKTLVLGYDSDLNIATAAGLGNNATYVWSIDGNSSSEALTPNGASCSIDVTKLTIGKHTLLVVGTTGGVDYSAECTITVVNENE